MKNILLTLLAVFVFFGSFAAAVFPPPVLKASEMFVPVGSTGQKMSLLQLSTITVKDFERISGRNLNFLDKFAFKAGQKKLRKGIAADGTISNKKLIKLMSDGDHSTGFHLGGFALGFLLGIVGVLLAYVIGGDEDVKRNRAKWSWIGLGVSVVLSVILILVVLKSANNL